jgi:two-component system sensor histidine kinase UhpB
MRILIIDDSEEDRVFIKNSISKKDDLSHIEFDESVRISDAIDKIKTQKYDSILLDLCLPDSNGLETISRILECLKEENKNIPIIIITGQDDYSIGKKAFNMGIKDFLFKNEIQPKEIARSLTFATYTNRMPPKKTIKKKII